MVSKPTLGRNLTPFVNKTQKRINGLQKYIYTLREEKKGGFALDKYVVKKEEVDETKEEIETNEDFKNKIFRGDALL